MKTSSKQPSVFVDTAAPQRPYLVVEVPPEQQAAIESDLERLLQTKNDVFVQTIILETLHRAVEQSYFWTPEWQAKERAADQAIAEGRVRTFDTMDAMIKFLDAQ